MSKEVISVTQGCAEILFIRAKQEFNIAKEAYEKADRELVDAWDLYCELTSVTNRLPL
jgi:hypothetical protein